MDYNHFVNETKRILGEKMPIGSDGAVLYTSFQAVHENDYFYILGLNPGGNDDYSPEYNTKCPRDESKFMTIGKSLVVCENDQYNEYEEQWKCTVPAGQMPFQRNLKSLATNILHRDISSICCTNLIFRTTQNQYGLKLQRDGDICWGVHEMLLREIKPDLIVACGNGDISPYRYLYNKLCGDSPAKDFYTTAKHGNYRLKLFSANYNDKTTYVLGLPHMSRYWVTTTEKQQLINSFLDEHIPSELLDKWRRV